MRPANRDAKAQKTFLAIRNNRKEEKGAPQRQARQNEKKRSAKVLTNKEDRQPEKPRTLFGVNEEE